MLSLGVLAINAALAVAGCPSELDRALLRQGYDVFDTSTGKFAWRTLLNQGCVDSAVATLKAYRTANESRLTTEQKYELSFHIGQALAMAGREPESAQYFEAAISPESDALWAAYVRATLGFVRKDRALLEKALAVYETSAPPESMRLLVIRGLLRCFDRPYMDAMHCGM